MRSVLMVLFVMALLVTPLFAVNNLDGLFEGITECNPLMETKINLTDAGSETDLYMTAVTSGGVTVLSVGLREQIISMYTAVGASAYIGLEMGTKLYMQTDRKITVYKTEFG